MSCGLLAVMRMLPVLAAAAAILVPDTLPAADPVPPGAAALGYTKCVIRERPTAADIAPGDSGRFAWFSGQWWSKPVPLKHYATKDGVLAISPGGDLVSAPRDFTRGKLPLLPGADGFYVEFDVRLSGNDPDHFPAVWLMPAEHNAKMEDQYGGDPAGYQRWMEFDIDEGGFGPGLTGTVHAHEGIWPKTSQVQNPNNVSPVPLDRTKTHTFGGSYDPRKQSVTWWVNGVKQMSAGAPYVPAVAAKQNFYLILSAQTHGKNVPYTMFVSGVRAWVPPHSKIPAR